MKRALNSILTFLLVLAAGLSAAAQTYLEEPAHVETPDRYVTTTAVLGGSPMRSFTFRYDTERRIALWVAYPLNAGLIGSGSRGDGWEADPSVDESDQAILYKGFRYGSGFDRGHQIPSADRLDAAANRQTFRFTNATPQLHDFNGGIWAELEKLVRTWAKRSDTLYVVTGAVPGDGAIEDNAGNPVNIPLSYYKAVLRRNVTRRGTVQWSAAAVLLRHEGGVPVGTWQQNAAFFREHSLPLSELEKITGETYFPLMEEQIGREAWLSMKRESPSATDWWWK